MMENNDKEKSFDQNLSIHDTSPKGDSTFDQTLSTHSSSLELNPNATSPRGDSTFDQLTLELMCNKKKYNKIIEKTNPKKFEENREQLIKLNKYSNKIMNLTKQILDYPDIQITNEINNAFEEYSRVCIRYFEMKEYENKYNNEREFHDEDEDMLFYKMDESYENNDYSDTYFTNNPMNKLPSKSYWGKSINKI